MRNRIITGASKVIVNGRVYNIKGNITIENGKMLVNGKPIEDWEKSGEREINITIEGDMIDLQVDCCNAVTVNGDVKNVHAGSGDVNISGCVRGSVNTASGDVRCGDIEDGVSTASGDVHCGAVGGRVSTMSGDVYKK